MARKILIDRDLGSVARSNINDNFAEINSMQKFKVVACCEFKYQTTSPFFYDVDTFNISSITRLGSNYGATNSTQGWKLTFSTSLNNDKYYVMIGDYAGYSTLDSGMAAFGDTTYLPLDHVIVAAGAYPNYRYRVVIFNREE